MKGTIVSFRRSVKRTAKNQMIIEIAGVDSKEKAQGIVGKKVTWSSPGNKVLTGKISAPHGGKGAVRAIFETGMPGQSLATKVDVE